MERMQEAAVVLEDVEVEAGGTLYIPSPSPAELEPRKHEADSFFVQAVEVVAAVVVVGCGG